MEVVGKIIQWHHDRNLIDGATDDGQFKKLMSEFGEYSDNLAKGRCTKDDIGDMGVVLLNIAERNECVDSMLVNSLTVHNAEYRTIHNALHDLSCSVFDECIAFYQESITESLIECWETLSSIAHESTYTLKECLEVAYNDIKNRKGQIINGTFVKESDL